METLVRIPIEDSRFPALIAARDVFSVVPNGVGGTVLRMRYDDPIVTTLTSTEAAKRLGFNVVDSLVGPDVVTITKQRLAELLTAEDKLRCLENGGVDNWPGYMDALEHHEGSEVWATTIADDHHES